MKHPNHNYEKIIKLCHQYRKELCFSDDAFIDDLKQYMSIANKNDTEQNRVVICPHCKKDHLVKVWFDFKKNKVCLYELKE